MNRTEEIIFGILSGAGAILIASILTFAILMIVSSGSQMGLIFFIIYLSIFIITLVFFTKGLFRKVYLISTIVILLVVYFILKVLLIPTMYPI